MKKLVNILIVALPLLLIVALFAATSIVRLSADIPVTGIRISNKGEDGVFYLDMANYSPIYESELGVEVLPRIAGDKKYALSVTNASGTEPSDLVTLDDRGAFVLHGIGRVKLTYTSRDGGYSDSVVFDVSSSGAVDFVPVIFDRSGEECPLSKESDDTYFVDLCSGNYTVSPSIAPIGITADDVVYKSENDKILYFNNLNGGFNARFGGEATIKMTVAGAHGDIVKYIRATVTPASETTLNGVDAAQGVRIPAPAGASEINFGIQTEHALVQDTLVISGVAVNDYTLSPVAGVNNAYIVNLNLSQSFGADISHKYNITIGESRFDFFVDFKNYTFDIIAPRMFEDEIVLIAGSTARISVSSHPFNTNIKYEFSISDQNSIALDCDGSDKCRIAADAAGEAILTVNWTAYDSQGAPFMAGRETRAVKAVNGYSSLMFAEAAATYGMGELAIASDRYDEAGRVVPNKYTTKFKAYDKTGNIRDITDVEFISSDISVAQITHDDDGVYIHVSSDGVATVAAVWKYGELFGVRPASMTFTAVNGIAVDSDETIRKAFADKRAAVLESDIYLGENLFDVKADGTRAPKYSDSEMRQRLMQYTGEIKTTADWKYYENIHLPQPTVKYCLDITADLHGNGHTVSAQYITDMLDSTDRLYDFAVFKGPLDFVAAGKGSVKLAAVKAQDNIVFLVRTDGVRVDNAVLKGCDDAAIYDNGAVNLSLLNHTGTTLEVMADASVTRCRVMNGRTVVRAFGRCDVNRDSDVNAAAEKINVSIENCVLQNAREFILKIGTNRVLRGTTKLPDPSLTDGDGNEYDDFNSPACDGYISDEYFCNSLVLTKVELKDSVLRTSGLFTVGIESHFSGTLLADAGKSLLPLDGWKDLAATSYPAILKLTGKVELDDWKNVAAVDSSTLIESGGSQNGFSFLSLNIAEMLKTVQANSQGKYDDIIYGHKGISYVHGGIAFYGGGKNYSVLDMSDYTFEPMRQYNVNLSILAMSSDVNIRQQGALLPGAAGVHDFRFVMFDAASEYKPS